MKTAAAAPQRGRRIGVALSTLVILFALVDAGMKLMQAPAVLDATADIGWPAASVVPLGLLLLLCTMLYAWPRTSVLGAILLTAYLGGAVATHWRLGNPVFSHVLFGVYIGVMTWAGLYLRSKRLRSALFSPSG